MSIQERIITIITIITPEALIAPQVHPEAPIIQAALVVEVRVQPVLHPGHAGADDFTSNQTSIQLLSEDEKVYFSICMYFGGCPIRLCSERC